MDKSDKATNTFVDSPDKRREFAQLLTELIMSADQILVEANCDLIEYPGEYYNIAYVPTGWSTITITFRAKHGGPKHE